MATNTVHISPGVQTHSDNVVANEDSPCEGIEPIRTDTIVPPPVSSTGNEESDTDISTSDDETTDSDEYNGIEPVVIRFNPKIGRIPSTEQYEKCVAGADTWDNYDYSQESIGAGDLEWSLYVIKTMTEDKDGKQREILELTVQCNNNSRLWKADAHVKMMMISSCGEDLIMEFDHIFSRDEGNVEKNCGLGRKILKKETGYVDSNGRFNLQAKISFRSLTGVILPKKHNFSIPSRLSDAILVVGGRKLHVSSQILGMASPVFEQLFFDDRCSSTDKLEFRIKKVAYKAFVEFLSHLCSPNTPITATTVESLLSLANRFKTETITDKAQKFILERSDEFSIEKKMLMGDKFALVSLQDVVINELNSMERIKGIMGTPEYAQVSDRFKLDLFERLAK